MSPSVTFATRGAAGLPSPTRVVAGGLIGRLPMASLRLHDPRVSEAHAMVSLRGHRLVLLALRGRLKVGRTSMEVVTLSAGQRIELAPQVELDVLEVEVPRTAFALLGLAPTPVRLEAEIATLYRDPWRLEPGFDATGLAHICANALSWTLHRDGTAVPLEHGTRFTLAGRTLEVVEVPLDCTSQTQQQLGSAAPLVIEAFYETVHLKREGHETAVITGVSARILTELVRFAVPTPWDWVARELFDEPDRDKLRMRWDRNLRTLRRKLREAGVRGDLVFSDGHGNIELVLGPDDTVRDAA